MAEKIDDVAAVIAELEDEMSAAASRLEFERAALLRDQINSLKSGDFRKALTPAAKKKKPQGRKFGGMPGSARRPYA